MLGNQDPIKKFKEVHKEGANTVTTYESGETFTPAQVNADAERVTARQGNPPRVESPTWSDADRKYDKNGGTKQNPFRP